MSACADSNEQSDFQTILIIIAEEYWFELDYTGFITAGS